MSAMFCGRFEEESKPVIEIPDLESGILRHCLHFLYLDECPRTRDVVEAVELLAASDRFCLPRLMDLVQRDIVTRYLTLSTEEPDQSRSECMVSLRALELLEVAEVCQNQFAFASPSDLVLCMTAVIHCPEMAAWPSAASSLRKLVSASLSSLCLCLV